MGSCFTIFAGFPATTLQGGTSLVTTLLAAITDPSLIVTPFNMTAPKPIHTLSLIITGFETTPFHSLLTTLFNPHNFFHYHAVFLARICYESYDHKW